jgi:hypothetical protein
MHRIYKRISFAEADVILCILSKKVRGASMPREHWNDVPGDIAGEDAENLPGGFGLYNPDLSPDAYIDEMIENDVISPAGTGFAAVDQQGGTTSGTGYAESATTGATVDPADLLEDEAEHPFAAVDKRPQPGSSGAHLAEEDTAEAGDTTDEADIPR